MPRTVRRQSWVRLSTCLIATDGLHCAPSDKRTHIGAECSANGISFGHVVTDGQAQSGSGEPADECPARLGAIRCSYQIHRRPTGERSVVTHVESEVALRA